MKSFEERKAEVMLRSQRIIKKRKLQKKILLTCVPIAVCLCALSVTALPKAFSDNTSDITESDISSGAQLPMLEISRDESANGFEGYWAYDISELVNANPWNENMSLSTLPVYRTKTDQKVSDAQFSEMDNFLKDIANKLGINADKLKITDNAPDENEKQIISEKLGSEIPEEYLYPSKLSAKSDGIEISVDKTMCADITLNPAVSLPKKYDFSYYAPLDSMRKAAEYLKNKYSALFGGKKYTLNISGGDYDIYLRQHYYVSFFCNDGDNVQKIINYNFNSIYFYPDDDGKLDLIRIDRTDLSDKVGDYPIITIDKARELLTAGKYVTSVPYEMPETDYMARVELIYRHAPWEEYYMPYYRFYVELPDEPSGELKEAGLKTYGAYYVPAVEEKYISNMPSLWNGSFN